LRETNRAALAMKAANVPDQTGKLPDVRHAPVPPLMRLTGMALDS
jgi:hypothetical protein